MRSGSREESGWMRCQTSLRRNGKRRDPIGRRRDSLVFRVLAGFCPGSSNQPPEPAQFWEAGKRRKTISGPWF